MAPSPLPVRLLCWAALLPAAAAVGERLYRNYSDGVDPDALIEVPILSPVPLTGGWVGGNTMKLAAEIAMDIVNSQQLLLPGYRITTTWFDDQCNADVGIQVLMREFFGSEKWVALGSNGCSAVCGRTATVTPQLRIPHISYGCAAGFLSDTTTYPHFQRFMTVENDMAKVFHSMGRQFGWTRIIIISGNPLRFEKPSEYLMEYFAETDITCDWLTPRNPSWTQVQELMTTVKRSSQRAIVVLGYEPFYRQVVCASFLAGMPRGAIWMSVGWHADGWWKQDDASLIALEPRCDSQLISLYFEGGIGASGLGAPEAQDLDTDLECMPGHTPRSFRAMLSRAFDEGYPVGENFLPGSPYVDIQGNAADGICVWAMLFRHMLNDLNIPFEDLSRPNQTVYEEMVRFIKDDIHFGGISGPVDFTGNDIKGILAVNQVQDSENLLVATVNLAGELVPVPGVSLRWGDGASEPGSEFAACEEGTIRNADGECEACHLGYQYDALNKECAPCPLGLFGMRTTSGVLACARCSEGTYTDELGMTLCRNCSAGSHAGISGATACESCPVGHQSPMEGMKECELCPRGTWNNATGVAECNPCPIQQTTINIGTQQDSLCTCAGGDFFTGPTHGCTACAEGLVCDLGGLGEPLQDEGFYVRAEGDFRYTVFRCLDSLRCPRGLEVGTCPHGRTGIACDICFPSMYPREEDGTCQDCGGTSIALQIFLTVLVGCIILVLFLAYTIHEATISRESNLTVMCCVSIVLTSVQALSAFVRVPINWIEPVTTAKKFLDLLSLRVDIVQPSCLFKVNTAFGHYVGSLVVFPVVAIIVGGMFGLIRVSKRIEVEAHCVWNALGRVFLLGYLPLSLLAFTPYQCIENPQWSDAPQTLATYRSIVCWESGAHKGMIGASVVAVLAFPVFLLVVVLLAVLQFPARLAAPGGIVWLKKYSFLFQRFRSDFYYYALVHLLRSFFVALVPNILPNELEMQVMLMVFIIGGNLAIQCSMWAWRTFTANVIDALCSMGLLLIMAAGGMLIRLDTDHSNDVLQVFMTIIFLAVAIVTFFATVYYFHNMFFPPKRYAMFLSHHKGGAAVLCRFLKLVVKEKVYGRIFLDCDELDNLAIVFSIAAEDCKNFVMVLTHDTLQRFWCAGEIASAHRHKTQMIALACDDFESPTDEFIDKLDNVWSHKQKCELSVMGVSVKDVQNAYRAIQTMYSSQEMIKFSRDASLREQDEAIAELIRKCVGLKHKMVTRLGAVATAVEGDAVVKSKTSEIFSNNQTDLFITGNFNDMEAIFTVRVLHRLLQFETLRKIEIINNADQLLEGRGSTIYAKQYLLLVCTKGILECEHVPHILEAAEGMVPTPVVTDPAFIFPDPSYYKELLMGNKIPVTAQFAKECGLQRIAELYLKCFKTLSMTFTAHGSEMIQATEIKAMCRRLVAEKLKEPLSRSVISENMRLRRDPTARAALERAGTRDERPAEQRASTSSGGGLWRNSRRTSKRDSKKDQHPAAVEEQSSSNSQPPITKRTSLEEMLTENKIDMFAVGNDNGEESDILPALPSSFPEASLRQLMEEHDPYNTYPMLQEASGETVSGLLTPTGTFSTPAISQTYGAEVLRLSRAGNLNGR